MSLQNLKEDYLYEKLPSGLIDLDEQSILRALIGGVQDRISDLRSYVRKYEVLFSATGTDNTVVLITFETAYGKVVSRSIDIQDDTPTAEGDLLTAWAADQLGLDVSQITSCTFGEDLLRYVDAPILQMLASTIGAVLYQTAAQSGSTPLNQQRILNSYFPRLKIKGTAMSFDILGKLIGFDDVRMTPLWGRLSPREPNDIGSAANEPDFAETPDYYPQQAIGVAYDPHVFRDGPYYTWTGTVSADPESTGFYSQTVNGFQPWVKVNVTGSVVHPAIGDSVFLAGGSPHTKAVATAGTGLQFQALGEGEDFNGLQVTFLDWNSGTDRLVSITDRLSAVKYRTSYFDLALTLTDEHAIQQFGTTTAKPNKDLIDNPALAEGRTASSPYRPWRGGSGSSNGTYSNYTWYNSGTVTPVAQRTQATTALTQTQFKTDDIQAAGQEALQIMDEVRAATRFPRRSSVGFLDRDDINYAGQIESVSLFDMSGTSAAEGIAHSHPKPGYTMSARVRNSTALEIDFPTEVGYTYYVVFSASVFDPYVRISAFIEGDGSTQKFYAINGAGSGLFLVKRYPTVAGTPTTTATTSGLAVVNLSIPLQDEYEPTSNGTIIMFSDGVFFNGTYDTSQHWYRFESIADHYAVVTSGLQVDAYWAPTSTEVVRSDPNPVPVTQVFAAFGDSTNNNNTYMVGTLVASWNPEFLLMLGDHNYTLDPDEYANENRPFLPWINDGKVCAVPGNHDLDIDNGAAFYNFFKHSQRYYSRRIGNVEVFAIDDGLNTAQNYIYDDWQGQLSEPARWLKEALSASQAPWKVVILHQDPYISVNSGHGSYVWLRWPFKDWGADVVMFGHVHAYEHMYVADAVRGNNGIHMLCIGFGGRSLVQFTGGASFGSLYRFPQSPTTPVPGASRFTVTATTFKWDTYTTDGVLRETYTISKSTPSNIYQNKPEDEPSVEVPYEVFDEFPWRRDLVGNGELIEINSRTPPVVGDFSTQAVSSTITVKDQSGVDYTVYGVNSSTLPLRIAAGVNTTGDSYSPGQLAIAYRGEFIDLLDIPAELIERTVGQGEDISVMTVPGFKLYHAGLVQSVLVADPVGFFGPHHRNGLVGWMPMNEHPDDAITVNEVARNLPVGVSMVGARQSDRLWSDERGWYLYLPEDGTVTASVERDLSDEFSMSFWLLPNGSFSDTRIVSYDPLFVDSSLYGTTLNFRARTASGTEALIASGTVTLGEFNFVTVSKDTRGYSCGIGKLNEALTMLGTNTSEAYSPFDETENTTLILRSPSSAGPGSVISGQPLDIVFCLDYSGSMAAERAALIAALGTFDAALTTAGFSTRYGFTSFGELVATPVLVQDLTTFTPFLAALSAYNPPSGGTEYGSVSVSTACGAAWTSGSVKLVILLTDEDDDSGPTGAFPNAGEVDQASTDLTSVGALFFYSAQLSFLGSLALQDPYIYQNLASGHDGAAYDLATFLLDPTSMLDDISGLAIEAAAVASSLGFHDVRIWNRPKTEDELNRVRNHHPNHTICTYWPTSIQLAGNGDRYGMRVLDNGFITLDAMPPAVRLNHLIRVTRYDDQGRFTGENRFNEVGLGGGTPLPPYQWRLGQQFYEMTSTGTVAFCTSLGGAPSNETWGLTGPGVYLDCPMSGSTSDGITAVPTATSASPWPQAMDFNNPAREFIWIKGDDNKVYEVALHSTTTAVTLIGSLVARERSDDDLVINGALRIVTAQPTSAHGSWSETGTAWVTFDGTFDHRQILVETTGTQVVSYSYASKGVAVLTDNYGEVKVYHPQSFRFAELPTGARTELANGGYEMTCNYGGYVYGKFTGSGTNTPPLYMYLTSNTFEDTSVPPYSTNSVWGRWTDKTDASLYGNTLSPAAAALDANGILEFENSSDLVPGNYRLTIESGCIGRVDEDFDGFSVIITIDTVQMEKRLLIGKTGADFTGTDVFEFYYGGSNSDTWLLTLQYLNSLVDVNRGTQRNLVINNYKLERIGTTLYSVNVAGAGAPTLAVVQTGSYTGTNPGGWLAVLDSNGSIASIVHESNIFPANDTVTSVVPLSSMLTSNTWQRREDHYASANTGDSILPDDAAVAMPTFGGIIVR